MFNFFSAWRREREIIRALSRLSNRELEDIGIARGEVKRVVRRAKAGSEGAADTLAPSWGSHLRQAVTR